MDVTSRLFHVEQPGCNGMNVLMSFEPIVSPTGICYQRYVQLIGILHFLYYDLLYFLSLFGINREVEFVVYWMIILLLMSSALKRLKMRTIATLIMSASEPRIGALIALRSANPRTVPL